MEHIDALSLMLSNERIRLANAKTNSERQLRAVWVKQLEKEVAFEREHFPCCAMTDEDLMKELFS